VLHVIVGILEMSTETRRKNKYGKKKVSSKSMGKRYYKAKYNPKWEPRTLTGPEKKWVDTNNTVTPPIGSAFNTTAAHFNAISQGTGGSANRVGLKVRMSSLKIRANILWNGGQTTNAPSQVRFVVVWDKQSNGALAARGDVFADATYFTSPINLTNAERFVVLIDEVSDIGDNGQFTVSWDAYRKFSMEAVYTNSSSIPNTGACIMFVAANSGSSDSTSAHFPAVEYYARMRYTDI